MLMFIFRSIDVYYWNVNAYKQEMYNQVITLRKRSAYKMQFKMAYETVRSGFSRFPM